MPLGFSVLVACADADLRDLLSWRLVVLGCSAATASTGDQTLDLLGRREFHLVVVDDGLGGEPLDGGSAESGNPLIREMQRRAPGSSILLCTRRGPERGDDGVRRVAWPKDARAAEQLLVDAVEESCAFGTRRANSSSPISVG